MSLADIKDTFAIVNIAGNDYKIVYNNQAISDVEQLLDCSTYDVCIKLADNEIDKIKDRLNFCLIGFKESHPEVTLETLDQIDNYHKLYDACRTLFLKRNFQPEIFETLALKEDLEKKKMTIVKKELTGLIILQSQKPLEFQKKNSGVITILGNFLRSIINTVFKKAGLKQKNSDN